MTVRLFGKQLPVAPGPLAPKVEARLREVQAKLDALRQRRGDLALNVALGTDQADAEMASYHAEEAALQREVADLQAAVQAAQQKDQQADAARRAAAHAGRVSALRQHLSQREKQAMQLSAALQNAGLAYEAMLASNVKIANLIGAENLPSNSLVPFAALRAAIAGELFCVAPGQRTPTGSLHGGLPGGAAPFELQGDPEGLLPLAGQIKAANQWLLGQMGAAPSPVEAASASGADPGIVASADTEAAVASSGGLLADGAEQAPPYTNSAPEAMATVPVVTNLAELGE